MWRRRRGGPPEPQLGSQHRPQRAPGKEGACPRGCSTVPPTQRVGARSQGMLAILAGRRGTSAAAAGAARTRPSNQWRPFCARPHSHGTGSKTTPGACPAMTQALETDNHQGRAPPRDSTPPRTRSPHHRRTLREPRARKDPRLSRGSLRCPLKNT